MNDRKLLPIGAMARCLGVTSRWLRGEVEAGRLPHLQAGKQILFDPETVQQVLFERARQMPPAAEVRT